MRRVFPLLFEAMKSVAMVIAETETSKSFLLKIYLEDSLLCLPNVSEHWVPRWVPCGNADSGSGSLGRSGNIGLCPQIPGDAAG